MKKMILASSLTTLFSTVSTQAHPLNTMNDRFGNQVKDAISFSCQNQLGLGGQYLSLTRDNKGYIVEIQNLDSYEITFKEPVELQPATNQENKNPNLNFKNKANTNVNITFDSKNKKSLVTLTSNNLKFHSENCLVNIEVKIASVLASGNKTSKESKGQTLETILKISDPNEMLQFFNWVDYAESQYHNLIAHTDLTKLFVETYTNLIKDEANQTTRLYYEFISLAIRSPMTDEQLINSLKQLKKLNPKALDYLEVDLKNYYLKKRNVEAILNALK